MGGCCCTPPDYAQIDDEGSRKLLDDKWEPKEKQLENNYLQNMFKSPMPTNGENSSEKGEDRPASLATASKFNMR